MAGVGATERDLESSESLSKWLNCRDGSCQSQEPRTVSKSPARVAAAQVLAQVLRILLLLPGVGQHEAGSEVELQSGLCSC